MKGPVSESTQPSPTEACEFRCMVAGWGRPEWSGRRVTENGRLRRDWQWVELPSTSVPSPSWAEALEHDTTEEQLDVHGVHLSPALTDQLQNGGRSPGCGYAQR